MEFDLASKRLQREQQQRSKQTSMQKQNRTMLPNTGTPHAASATTHEILLRQKQQRQQLEDQRQKERQQKLYETQLLSTYLKKYDSKLHVQSLLSISSPPPPPSTFQSSAPTTAISSKQQQLQPQRHLQLKPVSIHGNGDKITLPPSLLERLLQLQENHGTESQQQQQPWTFRIGIRNPNSSVNPVSNELQSYIQENFRKDDSIDNDDDEDDNDEEEDDVMDTEGNSNTSVTRNRQWRKKEFLNDMTHYMKELQQHQYVSYTHGTVVEFTQEEGYIGIPKSIANALLVPCSSPTKSSGINIETTRTIDPATAAAVVPVSTTDDTNAPITDADMDEEKTPGHVAYNAFDIPAVPIEIVLLHLPKGTGMTLRPILRTDPRSMAKSFYELQQDQIKYALEQSIQRTRATITLYDTLTTWYRGNEYQFLVTQLVATSSPSNAPKTTINGVYNAISCINTDIEIEFEPIDTDPHVIHSTSDAVTTTATTNSVAPPTTKSTGRRLMDEPVISTSTIDTTNSSLPSGHTFKPRNDNPPPYDATSTMMTVPPEPPLEEKINVITIQFRWSSGHAIIGSPLQRRFDITTTTICDLFHFVRQQQLLLTGTNASQLQVVRRYPRRIFSDNDKNATLQQAGFLTGNELLMIEEI